MPNALEYVRIHATEFDDLSDAWIDKYISSAAVFIDVSDLDTEQAALATGLYAAHLLWLARYQGSGGGLRGSIQNEKDKDLSRSYNKIENSDKFLGQSPYGQLYSAINGGLGGPTILTGVKICLP